MISFFGDAWKSVTGYFGNKYEKYPIWFNLGALFIYLYGAGYLALSYLLVFLKLVVKFNLSLPHNFYDWFWLVSAVLLVISTVIYLVGFVLNIKFNLNKAMPISSLGAYFLGQIAYGYLRGLGTNFWTSTETGYVLGHFALFVMTGLLSNYFFARRLNKKLLEIDSRRKVAFIQGALSMSVGLVFIFFGAIPATMPERAGTVWYDIIFAVVLMLFPTASLLFKWMRQEFKK